MANINQIYTLVNNVSAEALGSSAITVKDTSTLVALGDTVLSTDKNTDAFTGVLIDRIGKTISSNRKYIASVGHLAKDSFTYGMILQKLYVDMPTAKEDVSWKLENGKSIDMYEVNTPSVKQKFFKKWVAWEFDGTISDNNLKTAFTNASEMGAFIESIFTAIYNAMALSLENCANLCRANFIGQKLNNAKPNCAINILDEYNKKFTKTLKADACLEDIDFLKYVSMRISMTAKRMRKISKLFNDEAYARFTSPDRLVVSVLSDLASASETYLQADTYHNELVALPQYEEVTYWQSSGTDYSFDNVSKVNVKIETTGGKTKEVSQTGIICVMHDDEAIGVTMQDRRSKSAYNSKGEYTNYFEKATMGYFNDMSENGVVFYVADVSGSGGV